MQYFDATLLSMILMLAVLVDVLRFPLIKKDRGARFFGELSIAYSIFLVLTIFICLGKEGIVVYPILISRILWTLHYLSFPVLLGMWMHFNAFNIIDNEKLVTSLSLIHAIPLVVLAVIALIDISRQQFYPLNDRYEHLLPSVGTFYLLILSFFFCLSMFLTTLGHLKELQGSFLFISMLLPVTFVLSLITFYGTHTHVMFTLVNSFMIVLYYLIGQRESVRTDPLTGLPSFTLLKRKMIRILRFRYPYVVILLDIENFRYFNSRYGQFLGDQMLVSLASFLRTTVRTNEAYRLSNDQFCLCLPSYKEGVALSIVDKIKERLQQPWVLNERSVYIQVNMAIIEIPQQAETIEEFTRAINQLLLEIKAVRKRSLIVYTRESTIDREQKLNIISALRESIKSPEQVIVHYQPIYDAKTEQLVAAEALMRIDDRYLGGCRFISRKVG